MVFKFRDKESIRSSEIEKLNFNPLKVQGGALSPGRSARFGVALLEDVNVNAPQLRLIHRSSEGFSRAIIEMPQ
jgi:hypothetical protein